MFGHCGGSYDGKTWKGIGPIPKPQFYAMLAASRSCDPLIDLAISDKGVITFGDGEDEATRLLYKIFKNGSLWEYVRRDGKIIRCQKYSLTAFQDIVFGANP